MGNENWGTLYKTLLHEWWSRKSNAPLTEFDFMMPSMYKSGKGQLEPISYVAACVRFRGILGEAEGVEADKYTLHSCKTTLLSRSLQLRLPESDRAKQGHHRTQMSHNVGLYGRDDVAQMIWLQDKIRTAILDGWRPANVQMRGALPPLDEPSVSLEPPTDSESDSELASSEGFTHTDQAGRAVE